MLLVLQIHILALRVREGNKNKEEEKIEEKEETHICGIKTLQVYPTDPFIFIDARMKPGTFHVLGSTSQTWPQHCFATRGF